MKMATFGQFTTTVVPSDLGKKFTTDTPVTFQVNGEMQTGTITKQLKNSAVVEIDKTDTNDNLMTQSKGVVIVNYKHLTKI